MQDIKAVKEPPREFFEAAVHLRPTRDRVLGMLDTPLQECVVIMRINKVTNHYWLGGKRLIFSLKQPAIRQTKNIMAGCISSHPGGILGKFF